MLKVTMARSKVKSGSHHDVAKIHPLAMSLPSINLLKITVSQIYPRQDFQTQGHYSNIKGQIKVAP